MQEKREQPRAEVEIEIQYLTVQEFLGAYAQNISGGGLFIRGQRVLSLNQPVRLRFTLPGVSQRFEASGIVVWSNPSPSRSSLPSGMGIKFMNLDATSKSMIEQFVKSKAPPTPITRELPAFLPSSGVAEIVRESGSRCLSGAKSRELKSKSRSTIGLRKNSWFVESRTTPVPPQEQKPPAQKRPGR